MLSKWAANAKLGNVTFEIEVLSDAQTLLRVKIGKIITVVERLPPMEHCILQQGNHYHPSSFPEFKP